MFGAQTGSLPSTEESLEEKAKEAAVEINGTEDHSLLCYVIYNI